MLTPKRQGRGSPLSLEERFKVKSMVEKFGVEEVRRTPAFRGCQLFLQANEPQTPEEDKDMFKFPYREALGAFMWTATITRPDITCAVRAVARF